MGVFDEIYNHNGWGFGSGHGSLPSVTKGYRQFLEDFLRENNIKHVVDYGCGDWQFSRLIKWGDTHYTGLDIVPSVIDSNNANHARDGVNFSLLKPGSTKMPKGDLLIIKDVLQHLPNEMIKEFIDKVLPKFTYALVTNCTLPTSDINTDIEAGGFRPLDLRAEPFGVDGKVVYTFSGPKTLSWSERKFFPSWKKHVLLVG
jgi:SAM-dependent methyltransferase